MFVCFVFFIFFTFAYAFGWCERPLEFIASGLLEITFSVNGPLEFIASDLEMTQSGKLVFLGYYGTYGIH